MHHRRFGSFKLRVFIHLPVDIQTEIRHYLALRRCIIMFNK